MESKKWLTAKEVKTPLKISDCKLMHIRLEGKIDFKKEGRAYLYSINNLARY
jgi:hypothetical protein